MKPWSKVVALAGGVGGAKLALGLHRALPEHALKIIVNTGDDFTHWGLHISPDLDTVMYTLAGLSHPQQGWGLSNETFQALDMMKRYEQTDWFALGDRDLATHLTRTQMLSQGLTLSEVTQRLCKALSVTRPIIPMSDESRPTTIHSDEGPLPFQDWLVKHGARPTVSRVEFKGQPRTTTAVQDSLEEAELVVICPSNPYVSIDPILALDGIRDRLQHAKVIAISPIVSEKAIKGPLATMIGSIAGCKPSAQAICDHYAPLVDAAVVQEGDSADLAHVLHTNIVMKTTDDRLRLAEEVLRFASRLR